jgi:hypothetical protein
MNPDQPLGAWELLSNQAVSPPRFRWQPTVGKPWSRCAVSVGDLLLVSLAVLGAGEAPEGQQTAQGRAPMNPSRIHPAETRRLRRSLT